MNNINYTKKKDIEELVNQCWKFLADILTDKNQDILIKSKIIKKIFKLSLDVKKVSLYIQGGIYEFYLKYDNRNCPELKIWRKQVFERDNYVCQKCGQKGVRLEAHHIKRWVDAPELRFILNNGKTLCKVCHSKTNRFKSDNNAICER